MLIITGNMIGKSLWTCRWKICGAVRFSNGQRLRQTSDVYDQYVLETQSPPGNVYSVIYVYS